MAKPQITIHNVETDEIITREMNDDEFAQHKIDQAAEAIRLAEAQAKEQAKIEAEAKLKKLGLTSDDLRALGLI